MLYLNGASAVSPSEWQDSAQALFSLSSLSASHSNGKAGV